MPTYQVGAPYPCQDSDVIHCEIDPESLFWLQVPVLASCVFPRLRCLAGSELWPGIAFPYGLHIRGPPCL